MPVFIQILLLNIQFFTQLPLPDTWTKNIQFTPQLMQYAFAYMPLAGWIVGVFSALVFYLVFLICGAPVSYSFVNTTVLIFAVLVSTAAGIKLTGALHEDGLADVADALGGCASPQRALQIMKDSCVGTYAVLTLCMVLLLKICLLSALAVVDKQIVIYILPAAHVISRFFPLLLTHYLVHVGLDEQSKTQQMAGKISAISLWPGIFLCLPLLAFGLLSEGNLLLTSMAVASIAVGFATAYMVRLFKSRIQGFTGDCLGATQQVCELVFYASVFIVVVRGIKV